MLPPMSPAGGVATWAHRATAFVREQRLLWAVTLVGFAWRAVTIAAIRPSCAMDPVVAGEGLQRLAPPPQSDCLAIGGDSLIHYIQGQQLAEGRGIISPLYWLAVGSSSPGGAKPPVYSTFLGVLQVLGIADPTWQRLLSALVGSLAIFLLGYTATVTVGRRAGLITAVLVAVNPTLWINDGSLKNDGFIVPVVALVILLAYRVAKDPRPRTAAWFGAAVGLAALTRSETSMLMVFIGVPLFWGLRRYSPSARAKLWLVAATMAVLVVFPWVMRNLVSFTNPTFMSVGTGSVLLNGSCDDAYYGENLGSLSFRCFEGEAQVVIAEGFDPRDPAADESVIDRRFMEIATPYVSDNLDRLPVVVAARVGRIYYLYDPEGSISYDIALEDRGRWQSWSALWFFYLTVPLAVYGGVVLRRRGIPLSPLVGPIAAVAFTAATTFGISRFRGPADLAMCMLAGVALDQLWRRLRSSEPADADGVAPEVGDPSAAPGELAPSGPAGPGERDGGG